MVPGYNPSPAQRAANVYAIFEQVDVRPSEPEQLAGTHPGQGRSHEERAIEAWIRRVEQTPNLVQVQHFIFPNRTIGIARLSLSLDHFARRDPRALDSAADSFLRRGILHAEIVAHGAAEYCGRSGQHFVNCLRRELFSFRLFGRCILFRDFLQQGIAEGFDRTDGNLIHPEVVQRQEMYIDMHAPGVQCAGFAARLPYKPVRGNLLEGRNGLGSNVGAFVAVAAGLGKGRVGELLGIEAFAMAIGCRKSYLPATV